MRGSIFNRDKEKRKGKKQLLCVHEKREVGGNGGTGLQTKRQDIVSIRCANGKTVYGKEEGGNRGPGAKVERKQVDNDKFQSNQHNQQNIPRIPQPFYRPHIT